MKKLTIKIGIILVIVLSLFLLSCGKKTISTTSSTIITTTRMESSTVTINTEKQSKIDDYNNRLKELLKFLTDYDNATLQTRKDITDLSNKAVEAVKENDIEKFKAYIQVIMDKY